MADNNRRTNELDLLRFIAAFSVMLYHYSFRGAAGDSLTWMSIPQISGVTRYGFFGVNLFFIISGFVILMAAQRTVVNEFIAHRAARLYPAFWVCCTASFLVMYWSADPDLSVSFIDYLINLSMLGGFVGVPAVDGVYWSLFVELQFYALIAGILALGLIHRAEVFIWLWLIASFLLEALPPNIVHELLLVDSSAYFIAGCLFWLIRSRGLTAARCAGLIASLTLAIVQVYRFIPDLVESRHMELDAMTAAIIIIVMFGLFLLIATGRVGTFSSRSWATLGALTYPLYLIHQNIGYILFNELEGILSRDLLFTGVIVLMLLVSWVVHTLVEKPLAPVVRKLVRLLLQPFTPMFRFIDAMVPAGLRAKTGST